MQLVESYVNEVCRFVPSELRDEIARDLREAIAEEIYVLADARNEDATDTDVKLVLNRFGHPLKVAARYQPQRYLIGPEIFPAMLQTLRVVIGFALGVQVLAVIVMGSLEGWSVGPWGLFWMTFEFVLGVIVVVVGVFIAIEYSGEKLGWYETWRVQSLTPHSMSTISLSDIVTNIVTGGFFLLWWNDVVVLQNTIFDGALSFDLMPIWSDYFWFFNVVFGWLFVLHIYTLILGVWRRWCLLGKILGNAALIGLALVLITSGDLVAIGGDLVPNIGLIEVQTTAKGILLVLLGLTLWDVWVACKNLRGKV
jgi:hypothetical protein